MGAATAPVASVTAVLPDGRRFPGLVRTGRGLRDHAWTVGYLPSAGVRLIFRDAAGSQVAGLDTARPAGPPQQAQPGRGGVTVYSYPASYGEPAGHVRAYLIQGRVGFWTTLWGGQISPLPAAGQPVLAGLTDPFMSRQMGDWGQWQAFGYAHADVARVVLRLADGSQVATSTFRAGWPGSDLRLWKANVPVSARTSHDALTAMTATAYDAAGHVLGHAQVGQMP